MWQSATTADSVWQDYSEKLRNSFRKLKRRLLRRHFFSSLSRGSKTVHLTRIVEFPKFQLCDHPNAAWSYLRSYQRSEDWNSHKPLLGLLILFSCVKAFTQLAALLSSAVGEVSLQLNGAATEERKKKPLGICRKIVLWWHLMAVRDLQNKSVYLSRYNSVNKWMQQM